MNSYLELVTVILIAVGLAMDALAVSLGAGANQQVDGARARIRLAFHFGLFQALMPVLGWLAGATIAHFVDRFDHWIAMGLLAYVGINMIRGGLSNNKDEVFSDPSRGKILVILCIATSIDAFAVGLSLGMLGTSILIPSLIIGVITFALSIVGLYTGNRLGKRFGKGVEIFGGLLLIAIGVQILLEHTLFA